MPFCPKCGKKVSEKAIFCYYCGESLPPNEPFQELPITPAEPSSKKEQAQETIIKGARYLFDLYWTTALALIDAAGLNSTLELIDPYIKFHSAATVQVMKEKFKFRANDPFSMAVWAQYGAAFNGVRIKNFQLFDQGFTADLSYCPSQKLSRDFCYLTEFNTNHMVQAMDNNYEYCYTKMLARGDPYCQIMNKKKSCMIWGEVTKKSVEVPFPKMSDEELEYWQSANYSQQWIYMTNALVDFAGKEKAAEMLRPYMKALGKSTAIDLFKELGLKDRDTKIITLIIDHCNSGTNQKGEYLTRSPERVEKEITQCIFSSASQDICANALEARENGICEAINPECEFCLTKRMCKGDKTCHWVIKKKSAPL